MVESRQLGRADRERLYESFGPRLLIYLERRTSNPALAADLLQAVFVRLIEHPFWSESDAQIKSYLYRIAYSKLVDHARRRQRERLLDLLPWCQAAVPDFGSDMGKPFQRLKARDATMLWLAYVEEMNQNETAKTLGVPPGSVKMLLSRACSRLRHLTAESA